MGWTFCYGRRKAPTVAAELESQCLDWSSLPVEQRPFKIAHATGAGVVAFAMRFPKAYFEAHGGAFREYVAADDGSITTAFVILYKDGREFGWKDMSETMGPCEPVSSSILKHLSPLNLDLESARWAQRWRDDCAAYSEGKAKATKAKKALVEGATVKLAAPLNYGSFTADSFTVVTYSRRGKHRIGFRAANGWLCRVPSYAIAGAVVEAPRVEA